MMNSQVSSRNTTAGNVKVCNNGTCSRGCIYACAPSPRQSLVAIKKGATQIGHAGYGMESEGVGGGGERDREREGERGRGREREREGSRGKGWL